MASMRRSASLGVNNRLNLCSCGELALDPLRCTLLYGSDLGDRTAPVSLRLEAVSSSHCVISWLPVNSNFRHRVTVNSQERETLPAGFYMTQINLLEPDSQGHLILSKNTC